LSGSRASAVTLVVTGFLILVASFTTWRVCCDGPFPAYYSLSGVDLGFGVVTAGTGAVLAAIGANAIWHRGTTRFATMAGLAAACSSLSVAASLVWMPIQVFAVPWRWQRAVGWLDPAAIGVGFLGLIALAAALRLRRASRSHR
jgi:hypothetical protein